MTLISWNVNGIRAIVNKDFFESIGKLNPDILCLQETKAQDNEVKKVLLPMSDYFHYYNSAEKKGYSGTATLSKTNPLSSTNDMAITGHNAEGRVQCAEYKDLY